MTHAPYPAQPYDFGPIRERNTIGVIAFVCALVGLFTGGHLLSPIGLILGLAGLATRPRGLAIWAIVLGLLGTCGWYLVILLAAVALAGIAVAGVGVFFFSQADRIELTTDMGKIAMLAEDYKQANRGVPPADLAVLNLQPSTLIDPWGHPYHYVLTEGGPGFDVLSDGPDGQSGNDDDVSLSNLEDYWEGAGDDFKRQLQEFERRSNQSYPTKVRMGPNASVTVGKGGVTIEAGTPSDDGVADTQPSSDSSH